MNAQQLKEHAEKVYASKGKSVSATVIKCLRNIGYSELYPTSRNLKIAESARTTIEKILKDVESSEPAKMTVHLSGEMVLSEEKIKNSAVRYYEANVELARIRENLARRIKELESARNNIESSIPHAQIDEFKSALREVASLFGTEHLPDTL